MSTKEIVAISAVVVAWSLFAWWFSHNLDMQEEYRKIWGKENYELINKATSLQIKEQIPEIKKFVEDSEWKEEWEEIAKTTEKETWIKSSVDLTALSKKAWIDESKFLSCVKGDEVLKQFASDTAEWNSFWLTWTPGTLIINTKTNKYVTVKWAYPFDTFVEKIDALLTDTSTEAQPITADKLAAVKKTTYIEWSDKAELLLIEYSDSQCPFCLRQSDEKVIDKLHDKYADKLSSAFKSMKAVDHEYSETWAKAILCAGKLGWVEAHKVMYEWIFDWQ